MSKFIKCSFLQSTLIAYNVLFVLWGLAYVCLGFLILKNLDDYMGMSTEFSATVPFVLILIGTSMSIICTLGCMCAIKTQPALLYLYGGYLMLVFVLSVGTGISTFAYRNKIIAGFDQGLNNSMIAYRNGNPDIIAGFDRIQHNLECCGSHKYTDWLDLQPPTPIPLSCCIQPDCDSADDTLIFTQGCYDKVIEFFHENIGEIAAFVIAIGSSLIIGVILTCLLARTAHKARYQHMA